MGTAELLEGGLFQFDTQPTSLVSPAEGALINSPEHRFLWDERTGSLEFEMQIATDADFENIIQSARTTNQFYIVDSTGLDERTHYWRVKGLYHDRTVTSAIQSFEVKSASNYYVHADAVDSKRFGNKAHPFLSVQNAIDAAATDQMDEDVVVKILVAGGDYSETIFPQNNQTLLGGHDPNTWARQVDQFPSALFPGEGFAAIVASSEVDSSSIIDGFSMSQNGSSLIIVSGGQPILRNLTLNLDDPDSVPTNMNGLAILAAEPVVESITVNCQADFAASSCRAITHSFSTTFYEGIRANFSGAGILVAMHVEGGTATLSQSEFNLYSTGNIVAGIQSIGADVLTVDSSRIFAKSDASIASAISLGSVGEATVTNNLLYCEAPPAASFGVISTSPNAIFRDNTMACTGALGIVFENQVDGVIFENNILFQFSAATVLFREAVATASPVQLNQNLFFDGNHLYQDFVGAGGNCPDTTRDCYVDTGADGLLNGTPNNELDGVAVCGTTDCSDGNISTSLSTAGVFGDDFDVLDFETWTIKTGGPADTSTTPGADPEDIGAHPATSGVSP